MKLLPAIALLLFAFLVIFNCAAASDRPVEVSALRPDMYQLTGASDALFSPDGNYLAVQYPGRFTLLPADNIRAALDDPAALPVWSGRIIGFLPASILIYADAGGTYTIDPLSFRTTRLFADDIGKYSTKRIKSMVIASNDLIITGDGNADWDGRKVGNIIRFDLKEGSVARGARISAFWYASLSPGGRHILYEHGAESNNDAELYDIDADQNYRLSSYFDFPAAFPGHRQTWEIPIRWLNACQFMASVNVDGTLSKPNRWLILFDIEKKAIIWQTRTEAPVWPNQFELLNDETAFFNYPGKGFYRLSLRDGSSSLIEGLGGDAFAVSPDKQTVAFLEKDILTLHRLGGDSRHLQVNIVGWEAQTAYKGMQRRAPLWAPGSDALILFGQSQLIVIIVDKQATR